MNLRECKEDIEGQVDYFLNTETSHLVVGWDPNWKEPSTTAVGFKDNLDTVKEKIPKNKFIAVIDFHNDNVEEKIDEIVEVIKKKFKTH